MGHGAAAPAGFFILAHQPWRGGTCGTVPRVLPMNREGSRGVWHGRGLLARWAPRGAPCLAFGRELPVRVQEFSPVPAVPRMPPPACLNRFCPTSGETWQWGPCTSFGQRVPAQMWHREGWWSGQVSRGDGDWGRRVARRCVCVTCHHLPRDHEIVSGNICGIWLPVCGPYACKEVAAWGHSPRPREPDISRSWSGMVARPEVPQHPHQEACHKMPVVSRPTQV